MVVAELTRLGGEAKVRNGGNGDLGVVSGQAEALSPRVLGLVLQLQAQGLVLEVGKASLGGHSCVAETTSLEKVAVSIGHT